MKILIHGFPHVIDCKPGLIPLERLKHIFHEPRFNMRENFRGYRFLSPWEEMIEAALAEAGALSDSTKRGALVPQFSKDFGDEGNNIRLLKYGSRHDEGAFKGPGQTSRDDRRGDDRAPSGICGQSL